MKKMFCQDCGKEMDFKSWGENAHGLEIICFICPNGCLGKGGIIKLFEKVK